MVYRNALLIIVRCIKIDINDKKSSSKDKSLKRCPVCQILCIAFDTVVNDHFESVMKPFMISDETYFNIDHHFVPVV